VSGYLSHYEFQSYAFNPSEQIIKDSTKVALSTYKNLVLAGSIKVSEYFYRINNTFGYQNYFALLPVRHGGNYIGTLVLELKSKQISNPSAIPYVVSDERVRGDLDLSGYSYAFYRNGKLLTQYGNYTYSLVNYDFMADLNEFKFVNKRDINDVPYSHLVYRPNRYKLIVVSRFVSNYTTQLAAISFVFIVLSAFTMIVLVLKELWVNFQSFTFNLNRYRLKYFSFVNHMLYKTRIQLSMVGAVVTTLIVAGIITLFNISQQYRTQQRRDLLEKINRITDGFDRQLFKNGTLPLNAQTELAFKAFAEVNAADLNLYDTQGHLVFTTQPRLYQSGIIAQKMNAQAYLYLNKLQKLEYVNEEVMGDLNYIAAYTALKNNRNEPIGYLSLPDLTNEKEYQDRVGVFLNALINVYTLVFVAIGFFAVFIANQITSPLTLIQKILSQTNIGRKNEPIVWKRQDEIGNLIKEYNNMILALEESANKLARSERESAWREMAKQIAHEIKNPLTPLKLGVQLLEKSWMEKDPNFDKKFEKFSKSFIEQIESLSLIASEFSNFAKMPDTVLSRVDLKEIIARSVEVYQQLEQIDINFSDLTADDVFVMGDKDQLLRSFNNLIKNSIEAIPDGVRGNIHISLESVDGLVTVIFEDNGNGIPENVRERIFMPNFTTKSSGTGLGLAFVKQAIENMGGVIDYRTELGNGTTFYLTIPIGS
ncbi:MAG TPA: ATP-binding protein, partial [Sphingobacteriaceae bacterium]